MLVAQISDLHVRLKPGKGFDNDKNIATLESSVNKINGLDPMPQATIVSGDLVDTGAADEYALARKYLDRLEMPWFVLPGNHDDVEQFRHVFSDHAYLAPPGKKLDFVIEDFPLRLVGLDSSAKGKIGGALIPSQLSWLDETLSARSDKPSFIFVHHPPVLTGLEIMDSFGFEGAAQLEQILMGHHQVRGIACGHIHRLMVSYFGGAPLISCPSLSIQLACTLAPGAKVALVREPCGFLLHRLGQDDRLTSHFCYVEDFGGAKTIQV